MTHLTAGLYPDIEAERYHRDDLCESPSLSSGGVKLLLSGSPAEFKASNRRLTDFTEWAAKRGTPSMDLGSIGHAKILGSPCAYQAIDPQDLAELYGIRLKSGPRKGEPYTTWAGGAKEWRDERIANGELFISKAEEKSVVAAVDSMRRLLERRFGDWPIGDSEVTAVWQENVALSLDRSVITWCRARLDHYAPRYMVVLDMKFTEKEIDNASLAKKAEHDKWGIQAAFYLRGLEALGLDADFSFLFPVAQLYPPYQARFFRPTETRLQFGRADCDRGLQTFAQCITSGIWPEYDDECAPEVSEWEMRSYEERELGL